MENAEQILEAALRLPVESSERWDLVMDLHRRGDLATFQAPSALVSRPEPVTRALGVDVLAQLGAYSEVSLHDRPFRTQAVQLLLDRLPEEHDP
jgi:hypothetical protein